MKTSELRRIRTNAGNTGSGLEKLILFSQTDVVLTKIPMAAKYIEGGKMIRQRAPVDFVAGHKPTGKLIIFDAKSSENPNRLVLNDSHLPEHQRLELLRYGEAGFISGLLCECTAARTLYWCHWRLFELRRPSLTWATMLNIGSSTKAVQWHSIVSWNELMRIGESVSPVPLATGREGER